MTLITTQSRLIIWLLDVSILSCGYDVQIVLIVCSVTKPKVRIMSNGHRQSNQLIKYIYNKVSHTTRAPIS